MPPHLAIVGSVNFDLVVRAPRIVKEGENLPVSNLQTFAGGKGANRAVAAQRLGAKATLIGAVGADTFGGYLQDELAKDGVGLTYLARKDGCGSPSFPPAITPSWPNAEPIEPCRPRMWSGRDRHCNRAMRWWWIWKFPLKRWSARS
ncbi:MAG: hypothetical protein HYV03_04745 [Deltaproteobacteria bacterium]|nr:hypothetical protein [Deltaproteobacteria bacterium]